MSRQENFESSEFYHRRYSNPATMIILPIVIVLLCGLLFALFAKKEITAQGVGTVEPATIIADIQAPTGTKIIANKLQEGKKVHQGEVIVKQDDFEGSVNLQALKQKQADLQTQLDTIQSLQQGVSTNSNTIPQQDFYGYHWLLANYLNKVQELNGQLKPNASSQKVTSINEQLTDLQTDQLEQVAKLQDSTAQSIQDIDASIEVAEHKHQESVIKAPASGVLHLNQNVQSEKYIAGGTTVASVVPPINEHTKLELDAWVDVNQIAGVTSGQPVKFNIQGNQYINSSIKGRIKSIASSPEQRGKDMLYEVKVKLNPTKKVKRELRYGMSGKMAIVVGRNTYFNIWKQRILEGR
ncbi:HlyD family efflux transporter periplasmic adaptor subunit [Pediococcus claussenii]|nr:HlyD family efflux transporter periplasmic adaptor subunit [Pediococcus claussenii]ANZ69864.1 hypothetical protein AYR57_05880 [Pediococcus claussenii]ANZ71681.1 hypothetical protein AYR58_05885 [Pediococcus claussenii]